MAKRISVSQKASGVQTTNGKQINTAFVHVIDGATDAQIIAIGNAIAGLQNGDRTGINVQVDAGQVNGPYAPATANGGSSRAQLLFRNDQGDVETITLPLAKQSVSHQDIEAVLEAHTDVLLNSKGNPLGQLRNVKMTQIVDG
jgi:hypothetical protein